MAIVTLLSINTCQACALQNKRIFKELRSHGANTAIKDKEGNKAGDLMDLQEKGLIKH